MSRSHIKKTALIFGISGQDGSLLASKLLQEGWRVVGGTRRGNANKYWRLVELDIFDKVELINIHLLEPHMVIDTLKNLRPSHIYHFAGESFIEDSFFQPKMTIEVNCFSVLNVLEAIRISSPESRLFFASSSEVFGSRKLGEKLDETDTFNPLNPYGVSKLAAQQMISIYRKRHNLHAVSGIMFNHEGPFRARNFVTRKITYNLVRLKVEGGPPMQLGNFDSARDWGMAADYTKIIPSVLELNTPQDFVFATGKLTSVRKFLELSSKAVGFSPAFEGTGKSSICFDKKTGMKLAVVSENYFRALDTPPLIGNSSRLTKETGFTGSRDIEAIAQNMIEADLYRRKIGHVDV